MNHRVAALCHYLAAESRAGSYVLISTVPSLAEAVPRAKELGLIESAGDKEMFDLYSVRLTTPKGMDLANESLCVCEEMS